MPQFTSEQFIQVREEPRPRLPCDEDKTRWRWWWMGTKAGSIARALFISFLLLTSHLDEKRGIPLHASDSHLSPSTVIRKGVCRCFQPRRSRHPAVAKVRGGSVDIQPESDKTGTISLATLMKGFYQVLSEEQLEPDIKTHCMSFLVYCI